MSFDGHMRMVFGPHSHPAPATAHWYSFWTTLPLQSFSSRTYIQFNSESCSPLKPAERCCRSWQPLPHLIAAAAAGMTRLELEAVKAGGSNKT